MVIVSWELGRTIESLEFFTPGLYEREEFSKLNKIFRERERVKKICFEISLILHLTFRFNDCLCLSEMFLLNIIGFFFSWQIQVSCILKPKRASKGDRSLRSQHLENKSALSKIFKDQDNLSKRFWLDTKEVEFDGPKSFLNYQAG